MEKYFETYYADLIKNIYNGDIVKTEQILSSKNYDLNIPLPFVHHYDEKVKNPEYDKNFKCLRKRGVPIDIRCEKFIHVPMEYTLEYANILHYILLDENDIFVNSPEYLFQVINLLHEKGANLPPTDEEEYMSQNMVEIIERVRDKSMSQQ